VAEGDTIASIPPLPPVTQVMLNTVKAVNLHTMKTERYSGQGIPNQIIRLVKSSLFLHEAEGTEVFPQPESFSDIKVFVDEGAGETIEWNSVDSNTLLTSGKDDRVFVVDPVEGTLSFGNGIRGKMLPTGSNNVLVDTYHVVPGGTGNIGPHQINVWEGRAPLQVTNLVPTTGGRDAESIQEIISRAPSLLTSRDRAVTRSDFELIAKEASGEVARAACDGKMDQDGKVEVVVLPRRREGERVPDPFLSAGLRDHVGRYLDRRSLINVDPEVRLASFMAIDVSVTVRLRPNANVIQAREVADEWVRDFLDPYQGGLDKEGWKFGETLYAQDFARMVTDIPEVRHVVEVQLYDMSAADGRSAPGWEEGLGESELLLESFDLFVVRRVRIQSDEVD